MLLRMAWRNLWRHRSRTLILGTAVFLSYGLLLASMGMGDDAHQQMVDAAIEGAGGQVLVHGAGYWDARTVDIRIDAADSVLAALDRVAGVRAAIPRVLVNGLLSTAQGSRPVMLEGIVPAMEAKLKDISDDVKEGDRLDATSVRAPLLLGRPVAEELQVKPGDRVVLTASGADGEVTRALFHVAGIIQTGRADLDEMVAYTTLETAQNAVGLDGAVTQAGLLLDGGVSTDTVKARVERALGARNGSLEVLTWQQALPEMVGYVEIDDAFLYIYVVVMYMVVIFAIANTFLVAVMERVRELGLLNALGMRGRRISRMILGETVFLVLLAMAAGLALGLGIHFSLSHWGIPMSAFGVDDMELSGVDVSNLVIRSRITLDKWIVASVLTALATVAAAIYPALRAARLAPAEAMRFYE
ncbi:MAG: FtsX-like permease family protein [Gemmatimonadota bacterium]|jgi:ABC-type lipoprotein release transport system permease subunit